MKKLTALLLAAVCFMGLALAGCADDNKQGQNGGTTTDETLPNAANHVIEMTETTETVAQNGTTEYKILIPAGLSYSSLVNAAARELQLFLGEATDAAFEIVEDTAYSASGKYISVGETAAAEAAGISADYATVDAQGFVIETEGSNVYILGAEDKGTLNGVYGFLEHTLHFDYYFEDSYDLDKVAELPLYDYHIVERPDIPVRASGYGYASNYNIETQYRYRTVYRHDFQLPVTYNGKTSSTHTSLLYIPEAVYGEDHDEWFADGIATQLCFTAHGDYEEGGEYDQLVETAAQALYDNFDADETESYYVASFSLEDQDGTSWCTCDACKAVIDEYGAQSATLILFINDLAECLKAKFANTQAEENATEAEQAHAEHMRGLADRFILTTLVYRATEQAPYTTDANGNKVFSEDMKLHPRVAPFFAPFFARYTGRTFDENGEYVTLTDWGELSETLFFWTYDTVFSNSMLPFYSYNYLQRLYQIAYEEKVYYHYNQAQYFNRNSTAWAVLGGYLNAKLGWNCYADVAELTEKFFNGMYGSEGGEMYDIFRSYLLYNNYQVKELNYSGGIGTGGDNSAKFWPRAFVYGMTERMYAARDRLLENGETTAADNIELELVSPLYFLILHYSSTFDTQTLNGYKNDYRTFVDKWEINYFSESQTMSSFIDGFLQ